MVGEDVGEVMFKQYLEEHGYSVIEYERLFDTGKRPDFLLNAAGHEVVAEVKSFGPMKALPSNTPGGFVARNLKAVRKQISTAAEQLKGIDGYPLVAVLASPHNAFVPLTHYDLMQAMYGDLEVGFNEGPGLDARLGRNGKLYVDEPDGSTHGFHAYLSAIAVIRCTARADAWSTAWLRDHEREFSSPVAAYFAAIKLAEQHTIGCDAVSLDVYETVSRVAYPLPRTVFNGPTDTRWGETSPGRYGRLDQTSTGGAAV